MNIPKPIARAETEFAPCNWCDGTGKMHAAAKGPINCPRCDGLGQFDYHKLPGAWVPLPFGEPVAGSVLILFERAPGEIKIWGYTQNFREAVEWVGASQTRGFLDGRQGPQQTPITLTV